MIYVNVKSFEEMKAVAKYSGEDSIPSTTSINTYGDDTVVIVDEVKAMWYYAPIKNYTERDILSFEQFEQQYLNGTATQDIVNHPNHYNSYSREVIDTMQGSMTPEEFKGYLKGNVMKYINRYQFKNGVEDLKKAQWYLNKLTEVADKEELLEYSAF